MLDKRRARFVHPGPFSLDLFELCEDRPIALQG